jgi:hypothetical protein
VQREPRAAGAEIGDDRPVSNAQGIHDQLGLLPLVAIGRVEEAEIVWLEELTLWRSLAGLAELVG